MSDTPTPTQNAAADSERTTTFARLILLGIALPLLIASAAALVMVSWLPELPDPVATHWGAGGVDGTGAPLFPILIPLGIAALLSAFVWTAVREKTTASGRPTAQLKAMACVNVAFSLLLGIGVGGSLHMQRGLQSAELAPDPWPWMLLGAIVGLVCGGVVWLLLPQADRSGTPALPVDALSVAVTERVFWTGVVTMGRTGLLMIGGGIALLLVSALMAALAAAEGVVVAIITAVVLLAAAATTLRWRLGVGPNGLSVVSAAGWPAIRVPVSEIAAVRLIEVSPVADFGGWGVRWASGRRTGVVLQGGPAIEVARVAGRTLVVPVDDAATAVAVLQAALEQRGA